MAKETVLAVRQAELDAAQTEKEAAAKRDAILAEAQQNSKTMITSMVKEAAAKAENNLTEAKRLGEEKVEAAKIRTENEVLIIKEMVKRKEKAAINLVLSNVI